jgi:hypothetical protein
LAYHNQAGLDERWNRHTPDHHLFRTGNNSLIADTGTDVGSKRVSTMRCTKIRESNSVWL